MILPLTLILLGQPGAPPTNYFIPEGFHGLITVVYDEGCGQHIEGASGQRVVRVPESGIVIAQERVREGEERINCQFANTAGAVTGQVPQLMLRPDGPLTVEGAKPEKNTVYAAIMGTWVEGSGHEKFTYSMVLVGSTKEIEAIQKSGPAVPAHVAMVKTAVKNCRSH